MIIFNRDIGDEGDRKMPAPSPVMGGIEGSFRKSCQKHGYPESILIY